MVSSPRRRAVGRWRMVEPLRSRFPDVHFYNPDLTEVQQDVELGSGSRVGSFSLIHAGARIGERCTIGSHCNICTCQIGDRVSIQTGCHITRGVVIEHDVFVGPGVITLNDKTMTGKELRGPIVRAGARIGGGSVLLPGVEIGRAAIVGAGSVVTKSVAASATVAGNPARELPAHPAAGLSLLVPPDLMPPTPGSGDPSAQDLQTDREPE
ncbi:MAG: N-acetyltransferase [Candidatus Schekmanbacteria bacterium]|nr:N-acetyltransferase [Candidatus Schekmanbacteria bacterium]